MTDEAEPEPAPRNRDEVAAALQREELDLLIVGGGITGAGAAREAARRGLTVGLIERDDLASGTSSRSSKLVHGGLRYLEQFEFQLVFEAVSERRVLQEIAPHLVRPLPFLFSIYAWSRRGPFTIDVGLWLYDALSLFRSPKIHRSLRPKAVANEEPLLRQADLKGASIYYDCATDDGRLTLETALDARDQGALVLTHAEVESLLRDGERVRGARVRDRFTGEAFDVRAKAVINATGPWTDRLRDGAPPLLRPTKGVHIVVPAERLAVQYANVLLHPKDGRVMFAIPWGDRVYIGTTDTDYEGEPGDVAADLADVRYCLEGANHYFPTAELTTDDVVSTWAGLRPLIAEDGNPSQVSREHAVIVDRSGLVTIGGGKLTTYRRMAIDVVEEAVGLLRMSGLTSKLRRSDTDDVPLPGGQGWPEDDDLSAFTAEIAATAGISEAAARHLLDTYGSRAKQLAERIAAEPAAGQPIVEGRPELWVQVDWAVDEELAETVDDVLCRRTTLYLKDRAQGLTACEGIAERMAARKGWSAERTAAEVGRYRETVARSRAWQQELA